MKHQSLSEIHQFAEVQWDARTYLSRAERIERWADCLTNQGDTQLKTLVGTEYKRPAERAAMRQDNSPLSIAANDPVLREAGLLGDNYGEARRFFELSDNELHYVVCHCHCGSRMSAREAGERVRSLLPSTSRLRNALRALQRWLH